MIDVAVKYGIDLSNIRQLEALMGESLPDILGPLRQADADFEAIKASVSRYQDIARQIDSMHIELAGIRTETNWSGEAGRQASDALDVLLTMPDHARQRLGLAHQNTTPASHDHDEPRQRPAANAQSHPRTMLEYLIQQRDATYEELAEQFNSLDGQATISARHLGRLARGERGTAGTNPATRRALQAMFALPANELLRPWSAANIPATATSPLSTVDRAINPSTMDVERSSSTVVIIAGMSTMDA